MTTPALKPRLSTIAEEIAAFGYQDIVYDIGTDHAYLPIHLVTRRLCGSVVGTDIRNGPLEKARGNVAAQGLTRQIALVQGDGFDAIPEFRPDCVTILSGMGGLTLAHIADRGLQRANAAKLLIFQPMNHQEDLRRWLNENSFLILFEKLAQENRRIYNVLFCRHAAAEPCDEADYYIGKRIKSCATVYMNYLRFVQKKISNRLNGLTASGRLADCDEAVRLRAVLDRVELAVKNEQTGGSAVYANQSCGYYCVPDRDGAGKPGGILG